MADAAPASPRVGTCSGKFLDTRFERFADKTPRELLASDDADLVRDLVWQIKSGANS
jgi:hypothetical protein